MRSENEVLEKIGDEIEEIRRLTILARDTVNAGRTTDGLRLFDKVGMHEAARDALSWAVGITDEYKI